MSAFRGPLMAWGLQQLPALPVHKLHLYEKERQRRTGIWINFTFVVKEDKTLC